MMNILEKEPVSVRPRIYVYADWSKQHTRSEKAEYCVQSIAQNSQEQKTKQTKKSNSGMTWKGVN